MDFERKLSYLKALGVSLLIGLATFVIKILDEDIKVKAEAKTRDYFLNNIILILITSCQSTLLIIIFRKR